MPYKSDAQRRFFHAAAARGDIPEGTVKEFDRASKGRNLPKRKKKIESIKDLKELARESD